MCSYCENLKHLVCTVWVTALSPLITTCHLNTCIPHSMQTKMWGHTCRPQQDFSLLLNPYFKDEKGNEGILTLVLFIVPDQEADKCFPWQHFVLQDELSLSVDCFLVVCVPSLSFCQCGLKKALQWHKHSPEAPHYCLTNYLQNPNHQKGRACYN